MSDLKALHRKIATLPEGVAQLARHFAQKDPQTVEGMLAHIKTPADPKSPTTTTSTYGWTTYTALSNYVAEDADDSDEAWEDSPLNPRRLHRAAMRLRAQKGKR